MAAAQEQSEPTKVEVVARLERRLDRERRARLEAERIAEDGMRRLYEANQDLDRRILERTAELNEALGKATAADSAKSALLAQMSHQIKTPLNGLMGMLELLGNKLADDQSEDWHRSAMRSAARLDRMTSRLITYVELEGKDLVSGASSQPIAGILGEAGDRWRSACLRAGQLLSVDVLGDSEVAAPPELDLVFDELLSNVVEHSERGAVSLSCREDEGRAIVTLTAPGQGVDPALLESSLLLSATTDQATRADDHVHLGLALIDRIVGALGATWAIDGSTVHITMPILT